MVRTGAQAHAEIASHIDPANPVMHSVLPQVLDPSNPLGLALLNTEVTRQGAMIGYVNVFAWMTLACGLLFPLIAILKPAPPIPMSRAEAAHAD